MSIFIGINIAFQGSLINDMAFAKDHDSLNVVASRASTARKHMKRATFPSICSNFVPQFHNHLESS